MKKHYLPALLFLFYVGDAAALPDCPSSGYFDNCYGAYQFDDEGEYVGEWKDDKMHGQGTLVWTNGDKYVGEWKENKKNGQGTLIWAVGDKYVGEFKDNNMHGQGSYSDVGGDKYVGEWKDNKYHGLGTYTWTDGTSDTGYWLKGKFIPDICEDMGLTKGSDGFSQCVLKLMDD